MFNLLFRYHHKSKQKRSSHVATKTFQALRIFVNNELNELNNGLEAAHHFLKVRGICVTITFHSLEDRIVKRIFHEINMEKAYNLTFHDYRFASMSLGDKAKICEPKWAPLSKNIVMPNKEEIKVNPRARSAKLRAACKKYSLKDCDYRENLPNSLARD